MNRNSDKGKGHVREKEEVASPYSQLWRSLMTVRNIRLWLLIYNIQAMVIYDS